MRIAIMQPYLFPYLGYFQLINAVDTFVFYDDVNFIKGGWIHRNKLLVNDKAFMFTVALKNSSSFLPISETFICQEKIGPNNKKLLKTIEQSYGKAPFFDSIYPMLYDFLSQERPMRISELAIESVKLVSNYLQLATNFKVSSKDFAATKSFGRAERLVQISKKEHAKHYINPIGGLKLYDKSYFLEAGIQLNFLNSSISPYPQFSSEFVPALSIIDVLMFNSKEHILKMLNDYQLV